MNPVNEILNQLISVDFLILKNLENEILRVIDNRQRVIDIIKHLPVLDVAHRKIDADTDIRVVFELFKHLTDHNHGQRVVKQSVGARNIQKMVRRIHISLFIHDPHQGFVMVNRPRRIVMDALIIRNHRIMRNRIIDYVNHAVTLSYALFVRLIIHRVTDVKLRILMRHFNGRGIVNLPQILHRGAVNKAENRNDGNQSTGRHEQALLQLFHMLLHSTQGAGVGRRGNGNLPGVEPVRLVIMLCREIRTAA